MLCEAKRRRTRTHSTHWAREQRANMQAAATAWAPLHSTTRSSQPLQAINFLFVILSHFFRANSMYSCQFCVFRHSVQPTVMLGCGRAPVLLPHRRSHALPDHQGKKRQTREHLFGTGDQSKILNRVRYQYFVVGLPVAPDCLGVGTAQTDIFHTPAHMHLSS